MSTTHGATFASCAGMDEVFTRIVENVKGRLDGHLALRVLLQPTLAAIVAVKAGVEDARLNRPAYLWAVMSDSVHRVALLRDGWKDVASIFGAAVIMDVVYQAVALRWFYPGEAVLVAILLAVIPYIAIRGPVCRMLRRTMVKDRTKT